MLPALLIAFIAFVNSITSYHLSKISHKKISYFLSFVLFFIALFLIWKEYSKENNKPALNAFSVKISRTGQPNQYLLWFNVVNERGSALEDVRASVFDMPTAFDGFPKSETAENETTKAANKSLTPLEVSLGTIPGNNNTEVYRATLAGAKIKQYGIFQIELNWNNNSILYSFQIRERNGNIEIIHPQVRTRTGMLDAKSYYHFYSDRNKGGDNLLKEQEIKFD